jgi:hypothetical protein
MPSAAASSDPEPSVAGWVVEALTDVVTIDDAVVKMDVVVAELDATWDEPFGVVVAATTCAAGAVVGGGVCGGTPTVVAVVDGVDGVVVAGTGGEVAAPQSDPFNGLGGSPSMGGGGAYPGGGVSLAVLLSANDHPSTVPGGGLRLPAPRLPKHHSPPRGASQ